MPLHGCVPHTDRRPRSSPHGRPPGTPFAEPRTPCYEHMFYRRDSQAQEIFSTTRNLSPPGKCRRVQITPRKPPPCWIGCCTEASSSTSTGSPTGCEPTGHGPSDSGAREPTEVPEQLNACGVPARGPCPTPRGCDPASSALAAPGAADRRAPTGPAPTSRRSQPARGCPPAGSSGPTPPPAPDSAAGHRSLTLDLVARSLRSFRSDQPRRRRHRLPACSGSWTTQTRGNGS